MKKTKKYILLTLCVVLICAAFTGCGAKADRNTDALINVSYDPTREFYEEYNALFSRYWQQQTGRDVEVLMSHGGSGTQALSVANGLPADVVTLALEADINSIMNEGIIAPGWVGQFEASSAPYTSTIVFMVRAGNEKNISDWDDLAGDVGVVAPNPKTSGAARWIFLAAWAWAENEYGEDDPAAVEDFVSRIYRNIRVLDTGARGSTTTFCENGQGDVLLAWENEAFLILQQYPGQFEMVTPSISTLCQPSVAVVDEVVDRNNTRELAEAYLGYLYCDEAQRLIGKYNYRPSDPDILQEYANVFDLEMKLVDIEHFGGWSSAQETFFSDGGIFDRIYDSQR